MRNSFLKILVLVLIISCLGVMSIYSSTCQKEGALWQDIYKRQIIWLSLGLICFFIMSHVNYRRLWDINYLLYGAALFLLFLVFVLGIIRLGAQRWLKFAWFNFQPSEFAKLAVIIFLARYFSSKSAEDISLLSGKFGIFRGIILPFIFVAVPMLLIVEQPDLGSGLMLLLVFVSMLYLTNVRLKYIFTMLLAMLLPLPFFWHFLRDYQKQRLLVFLNPNIDPLGAGYTVIQSRIAIGSGGLFGKGWLAGTQSQLYFLPESHTDFIFATFSEQWGFLGSALLILAYYLIIRQGFIIAQRTQDSFGKLLAYGISLLLALQVFINIAMNMGLAPVVGLPLPLMSYGGSSVLITFISLGILVNIDRTRSVF
jgi:rod shape determining protein RodA